MKADKTKTRQTLRQKRAKPEPGWLNKGNMARGLGISVEAFAKWHVDPVAKIGNQVFYTPADVLENRLQRYRQQPAKELDISELSIERERAELALKQEQAETQRLKNLETNRQLARVDLLAYALSKTCAQIVATLDALPGQLKRSMPSLSATEIEVARREVAKCLNAVADAEIDLDDYTGDGEDS